MPSTLSIPQYTSLYLTRFANKSIPIAQQVFRDEFIQAVEQHIGVHGSVSELWSAVQSNFSTAYTDISNRRAGHLLFWSNDTDEGVGIVLPDTSKMRVLDPTATTVLPTVGVAGKSFLGGVDVSQFATVGITQLQLAYYLNFSIKDIENDKVGYWDSEIIDTENFLYYFDDTEEGNKIYKPFPSLPAEQNDKLKKRYKYFEDGNSLRFAPQILALEGKEVELNVQLKENASTSNAEYVWFKTNTSFQLTTFKWIAIILENKNGEEYGKIQLSDITGGIKLELGLVPDTNYLLTFYNDKNETVGLLELFENRKIQLKVRYVAAIRQYSGDSDAINKQDMDYNDIVDAINDVQSDIYARGLIQAGIELDIERNTADNSILVHRLLFNDGSGQAFFSAADNKFSDYVTTFTTIHNIYEGTLDSPVFNGIVIVVSNKTSHEATGVSDMESFCNNGSCFNKKISLILGGGYRNFRVYVHEIGHLLALNHTFEIPTENADGLPVLYPNIEALKGKKDRAKQRYETWIADHPNEIPISNSLLGDKTKSESIYLSRLREVLGMPFIYKLSNTRLFLDYEHIDTLTPRNRFSGHQWIAMREEALSNHHGIKL